MDELRFWVHPSVWARARPYGGGHLPLRLLGATTYHSGVTLLRYAP